MIMGTLFRSFLILPPSFAATSETCLLLSSSKFYCGVVLMPWQFNVLGEGIFIYIILQVGLGTSSSCIPLMYSATLSSELCAMALN